MSKLDEIFAYKRSLFPRYVLHAECVNPNILTTTPNPFEQKKGIHIIAEIKRASPTKPQLNLTANIHEQAKLYESAGAAMISVLTEEKYFGGSYEDLKDVHNHTTLPLLNKDFIYSKEQIKLARHFGASHILLITTMLSQRALFDLYDAAKAWGMEVLFEIHTPEDYEKIKGTAVKLVGINNRNLKSMQVDIQQTLNLLDAIDFSHHVISESGIRHVGHIKTLYQAGVQSFLIGEAFMTAEKPDQLIKSFLEVAHET